MIYKSLHLDLDKHSPTIKRLHDKHIAELRDTLSELYHSMPDANQNVFNLMYKYLDNVAEEQLCWAICQCETTLRKMSKPLQELKPDLV